MIRTVFFVAFLLSTLFSFAQEDSTSLTEPGDTIDVIVTDTSILYVIKKAPVKIFERVEIERSKEKMKIYLSLHGSVLKYFQRLKPQGSYPEYSKQIASELFNTYGIASGATFWIIREKRYFGIETSFRKFEQSFMYVDNNLIKNRFGYFNACLQIGKFMPIRENVISVLYGSLVSDFKLSTAGKTYLKPIPSDTVGLIKNIIRFRPLVFCPELHYKVMIQINEIILEAEPYVGFSLFSYTPRNEYYAQTRYYGGFRIGFVTKLN
jgi:hypothetical protein